MQNKREGFSVVSSQYTFNDGFQSTPDSSSASNTPARTGNLLPVSYPARRQVNRKERSSRACRRKSWTQCSGPYISFARRHNARTSLFRSLPFTLVWQRRGSPSRHPHRALSSRSQEWTSLGHVICPGRDIHVPIKIFTPIT